MTTSQISTLARGWLEYEGLEHLLPDPHTHDHVRGCIATYYPGGCWAFLRDVAGVVPKQQPTGLRIRLRSPSIRGFGVNVEELEQISGRTAPAMLLAAA